MFSLHRVAYIAIAVPFSRYKYLTYWFLSEGVCNMAGLGFSGLAPGSGTPQFDRVTNVRWILYEFPPNASVMAAEWNVQVGVWLKYCKLQANAISHLLASFQSRDAPSSIVSSSCFSLDIYLRVESYTPSFIAKLVRPKTFANIVTKMTSAFWHGFYPR